MKEGGEGRADPKVVGAPRVRRGPEDEKRAQRHGCFPRLPRALSRSLTQFGDCGCGSEAEKGAPTSPGRTRAPGSSRLLERFEAARRAGRYGAGVVRLGPAAATSRGAGRAGRGMSGAARSPGWRRRRRPAGGAAVWEWCPPQRRGPWGARQPPIKFSDPSAAPAVRSAPARRQVGTPPAPRPAQLSDEDAEPRTRRRRADAWGCVSAKHWGSSYDPRRPSGPDKILKLCV